ncbi:MAG: hypothetical protein ACI8PP_002390 [Candidatus Pseudothioglobus sp.]
MLVMPVVLVVPVVPVVLVVLVVLVVPVVLVVLVMPVVLVVPAALVCWIIWFRASWLAELRVPHNAFSDHARCFARHARSWSFSSRVPIVNLSLSHSLGWSK